MVHFQIGLPAVLTGGKQRAWAGSVGLPPLAKSKNEINLREEPRGVGVHLFSTPYLGRPQQGRSGADREPPCRVGSPGLPSQTPEQDSPPQVGRASLATQTTRA